jgi:O-antigen ligase
MENPAGGQQLKTLSLWAAGLLVAIFLGGYIGNANYAPLIFGSAVIAVLCLGLFSGPFFWVLTIASSFLGGTFPILGGSFTPFQFLTAIGVAKFVFEDIVLRRTRLRLGDRTGLVLIAGFMGVLTVHAIHDRFGMRFLGSNVWGGRNYVNVYLGLAAFFVIQSIPIQSKTWAKLPYAILAVTTFDLVIALVTTIFPNSIYKIYPFYSAVSRAGIEQIITGESVETARLGSVGNFGTTIIALVLASVSLSQILKPPIIFRLFALLSGSIAVLFSSFRSAVFNTLGVVFVASIRDLKWGILLLFPFLGVLLLGLSVVNSEVVHLPKQVQRSLTFVPGKWDAEMSRDAASSNDFRREVWTLWKRELFPAHPWLGRGFGFSSEWGKGSVYRHDPNANRQMVETGNIHNGFLATLDSLGIIGAIFFIIWNLRLLARILRLPFRETDPDGFTMRFLALILGASIICYWMAASDVGVFLPQEFALAAVLLRLQSKTNLDPASFRSLAQPSEHGVSKELTSA